ncbi:50S ribosomal protein L13 [Candidatus Woesebacteria bacterium]|nr:MAG: 50S ribosomal protein L13 [Candidatus Woesebacteria bacterium]
MKKTYQPKEKEIVRNWHVVDAKGEVLGRMSTKIAKFLMGKHKVKYAPHLDMGDYVVVINAAELVVTGGKTDKKVYYKHSGFPGGFKEIAFKKLFSDSPAKVVEHAVSGMLPKNRLHKARLRRMKVYSGEKHPYEDKIKAS